MNLLSEINFKLVIQMRKILTEANSIIELIVFYGQANLHSMSVISSE